MITPKKLSIEAESFLMHYGVSGMKRGVKKPVDPASKLKPKPELETTDSASGAPAKPRDIIRKSLENPDQQHVARVSSFATRLKEMRVMTMSQIGHVESKSVE